MSVRKHGCLNADSKFVEIDKMNLISDMFNYNKMYNIYLQQLHK